MGRHPHSMHIPKHYVFKKKSASVYICLDPQGKIQDPEQLQLLKTFADLPQHDDNPRSEKELQKRQYQEEINHLKDMRDFEDLIKNIIFNDKHDDHGDKDFDDFDFNSSDFSP